MADLSEKFRPNTVLLHIGQHKTGTTAIQKTLLENRQYLRAHGLLYPDIGFSQYGHHKLAALVNQTDDTLLTAIATQLHKHHHQTIILSSENFSTLSLSGTQRLARILSGFDDIKVIMYVRNFLELPYALWQEQVKHRRADDFNGFLVNCLSRPHSASIFNAAGIVEKFVASFDGKISVYLYDKVMSTCGDVARHFMEEILGILDYDRQRGVGTINRSLDPTAAEIVRCLNRSGGRGIRIFLDHPDKRTLHADIKRRSAAYSKSLTLSYEQPVFRQMELKLLKVLANLRLPAAGGASGEIFEKREHEIKYLDASIWLFEPELAARMRSLVKQASESDEVFPRKAANSMRPSTKAEQAAV